MNLRLLGISLLLAVMAGGCSTRTAYLSGLEMRRAQCDKLTDLQELQRCRADARQSYEDYQREQEAVKPAQ
jgi:hypothetical protein